ncbi:hypothetical protein ACFX1T_015178 [Malus domestica]
MQVLVLEIVITFGLVYTVYATAVDPKKGSIGTIAPIAIGFILGANILIAGAFDGASMNPAVSFGPAVVSWTWDNHWVYWLGPFIGAAIAAVVYELIFIGPMPSSSSSPLDHHRSAACSHRRVQLRHRQDQEGLQKLLLQR